VTVEGETSQTASSCLTADCNPPSGTVFDFNNTFSITPSGCTVSGANSFDTGTDLRHFVLANCGARSSVYTFKTSYVGTGATTPVNLSSDCASGVTGVRSFNVDKGASSYLVLYVCNPSGGTTSTKVLALADDGTPGTVREYETMETGGYQMAWNSTAGTYGVTKTGRFQRFNESGIAAGGSIVIANNNKGSFVSNGNWIVIADKGSGLGCSKISSSGTLQCDQAVVTSDSRYFGGGLTGSSPRVIGVDSYGRWGSYSINLASCVGTLDFDYVTATNEPVVFSSLYGAFYISNYRKGYGAPALSETIGTYLYKSSESLIFATFDLAGSKIYSEAAVTGYRTALNTASIKIIQNKLYVAYDKDGGGYVSYSTQAVP